MSERNENYAKMTESENFNDDLMTESNIFSKEQENPFTEEQQNPFTKTMTKTSLTFG